MNRRHGLLKIWFGMAIGLYTLLAASMLVSAYQSSVAPVVVVIGESSSTATATSTQTAVATTTATMTATATADASETPSPSATSGSGSSSDVPVVDALPETGATPQRSGPTWVPALMLGSAFCIIVGGLTISRKADS